jgi:hypothetical protein
MKLKGPLFSLTATGEFKGLSFSHNQHGANAHLKIPRKNPDAFLKSDEHIFTLQVLRYIWYKILNQSQRNSWLFYKPLLNSFISFMNTNYNNVLGDEKILLSPYGAHYFEEIEPVEPFHLIQRFGDHRIKLYILEPLYINSSQYNHYKRIKIKYQVWQSSNWEHETKPNGTLISEQIIVDTWYHTFGAFISAGIPRLIFFHNPNIYINASTYHTFELFTQNINYPYLEGVQAFWFGRFDIGYYDI